MFKNLFIYILLILTSFAGSENADLDIHIPFESEYIIYDASSIYNSEKEKYSNEDDIRKSTFKQSVNNKDSLNVIDKVSGVDKLSLNLNKNKSYLIYNKKTTPYLIIGPLDLTSNSGNEFFIKEKEDVINPVLTIKNNTINTEYNEVDFKYEITINDKKETFTLKADESKEFILNKGDNYEIKQIDTPDGYKLSNITSPSGIINSDLDVNIYNTYNLKGSFSLKGKSKLKIDDFSDDKKRKKDEFLIELIDNNDEVISLTTTNEKGEFSFDDIKIDKEGNFTYIVRLVNEHIPGYTYDDTEYKINISADDNLDGNLNIDLDYDDLIFNNKRSLLTGPYFRMYNKGSNQDVKITFMDKDNKITSGLNFYSNKRGYLEFINETMAISDNEVITATGMPYDTTYKLEPEDTEGFVLNNSKSNLSGVVGKDDGIIYKDKKYLEKLVLSPSKIIKNADIDDFTFNFELINEGKVIETVSNNGSKIEFSPIDFNQESIGSHFYSIKEINDKQANIEYDNNIYDIRIDVYEDDGKLVLTPNIENSDMVFNNSFNKGNIEKEVSFSNNEQEVIKENNNSKLYIFKKYWYIFLIVAIIVILILK